MRMRESKVLYNLQQKLVQNLVELQRNVFVAKLSGIWQPVKIRFFIVSSERVNQPSFLVIFFIVMLVSLSLQLRTAISVFSLIIV